MMKKLLYGLLILVLLVGLIWLFQGNDFFMYKIFAPKYEQVRRETFEQSKAYNQGMVQELENMYLKYQEATPEHKSALKSVILHRMADYPEDKLPNYLRNFVQELKDVQKEVGY